MRVLTLTLAVACAAALSVSAVAFAQEAPPPAAAASTPASAETVKAGAVVRDSAGADLGTVEQPMLDEAGALKGVAIRSPEGEVYALPAAGFTVQGQVVVAAWTKEQIDQARKAQAPAKPERP